MNTTKRSLRNVYTALFAPTNDRIYTTGQYLCGYAIGGSGELQCLEALTWALSEISRRARACR